MFTLYVEKSPLILIFVLSTTFMSACYQENTKKPANDLYYKFLKIGVIVLTCKSKLPLLTYINCSCLLRLFSLQNWVPHKSLVSTILLREIIWGRLHFLVVQLYSKLITTKILSLSHFENQDFWPCYGKDIV